MNTTQQPEALSLEEFRAKVTHAAREPLLARIAELEAQLSAIGAGGVERIVELKLNAGEQAMFEKSVASVKGLVDACVKISPALAG